MAKLTYEQIREVLEPIIVEVEQLRGEEARAEAAIRSGHYSRAHVEGILKPGLAVLREQIDARARTAQDAVERLLSDYVEAARREDQLRAEDMTADAALFQAGVELREQDLRDILERNAGNRTMTQMALRYAEAHGIQMGMIYHSAREEAEALAEAIRGTLYNYLTHWIRTDRAREMLEALFGERQ